MKPAKNFDEVFAAWPEQWTTAFQDAVLISQEWMAFWNTQWQNWLEVVITMQGLDKQKSTQRPADKQLPAANQLQKATRLDIRSPLPWVQSFSWLIAETAAAKKGDKSEKVIPAEKNEAAVSPKAQPVARKPPLNTPKAPAPKTTAAKPAKPASSPATVAKKQTGGNAPKPTAKRKPGS